MTDERRRILSWALYDWGNSAFATTVMAGFFPLFFKQYWSAGVDASASTFYLGAANSVESVLVAALAPVLGAVADRGGSKKRFLAFFAGLGVSATAALCLVGRGGWPLAAALYVVAAGGFAGSLVFYDALLVGVCPPERMDAVSGLGYALGYLGGGLLFALNVALTLWPRWFGLPDAAAAVKISFVSVALWWAAFSVPLLRHVPEPPPQGREAGWHAVGAGFRQLAGTLREVRRLRVVLLFLAGYWLYIDGVDTVIRMAVDYGLSLGFDAGSLIVALLITQFVGFPAALAFGRLGGRIGAKRGVLLGLAVYVGVTAWAAAMRSAAEFFALAAVIGLVQGGVQALSRSLYARIIPPSKAGEFFGFYNMLGKFAAVIGPLLMGWVGLATGSPRRAILSIALLFAAGGALLVFVDEERGAAAAAELEAA